MGNYEVGKSSAFPFIKYSFVICCLDGIDTYIISPEYYSSLIEDQELLENLIPSWRKDRVIYLIQTAQKFDALYLAFGHHKIGAGLDLEWEPVLCYKKENFFFNVAFRDSWMCIDCNMYFVLRLLCRCAKVIQIFIMGQEIGFLLFLHFFKRFPVLNAKAYLITI